jgi:peptidyl-Lys metalloendopeptidase
LPRFAASVNCRFQSIAAPTFHQGDSMFLQRLALGAVMGFACVAAQAAPSNGLEVSLTTSNALLKGDQDVSMTLSITNRGTTPVSILKWALPSEESESMLFRVTRDGEAVQYLGAVYKRTAPTAADYVRIAPGETLKRDVELSGSYDMSLGGHYSVEYNIASQHLLAGPVAGAARVFGTDALSDGTQVKAAALQSGAVHVWIEHSAKSEALRAAKRSYVPPVGGGGGVTYTTCANAKKADVALAIGAATTYATNANNYLAGTPSATQRFTKWFGTFSSANWAQVKGHYANEVDAFMTKPLEVDCSCKKKTVYAYVYPSQPYKIYVCGAFWTAPMTGTDSKGGTLVHEMSHFTVVAGTNDFAYGQSAAAALAISNPANARMNADSHEYFAENTPALP